MTNVLATATIRDRGQITIPEKIRQGLKWPSVNAVVSLSTITSNELIIKPYQSTKSTDWSRVWNDIKLSRSYTGRQGDLAEFISSDRENH